MEAKIKNNRIRIDGLNQLVLSLEGSPQLTKCSNGLLLGKAWLGKVLGALGTESPYPADGNRHSVKDIEKTADTLEDTMDLTGPDWGTNHIEKVDWLRQQIQEVVVELNKLNKSAGMAIMMENAYTHLAEARFWLGFELERIKKSEENPEKIRGEAV